MQSPSAVTDIPKKKEDTGPSNGGCLFLQKVVISADNFSPYEKISNHGDATHAWELSKK